MNDIRDNIENLRQLVKAENEFIHHRLTWLGTFQGLLFAALAFAWGKDDTWWIIIILCFVGLTVALSTWVATLRANKAIESVNKWWDINKPSDYLGLGVELVKGHEGKWQILMPGKFLPFIFFVVWIAIGLVHLTRCS